MKPCIVITGANGFTGQHACRHFAEREMRVVAVIRNRNDAMLDHMASVEICCADLTDKVQVKEIVRAHQPDYVLHLAGKNDVKGSWEDPVLYMESNLMSTLYLLDALRSEKLAACRMLIAGSSLNFTLSETPNPPHPYSFSKTFQTAAAKCWHVLFEQPVLIAEPSNLVGPGPSNGFCGLLAQYIADIEKGKKRDPFIVTSSEEKRDFIDVRDVVNAYEQILLHGRPGAVYPIGSGKLRSLGEAAAVLKKLAKCDVALQIRSEEAKSSVQPAVLNEIHALGWRQQISFQQSMEAALHYFRSQV